MLHRFLGLALLLALCTGVRAQLPNTQIYTFDFQQRDSVLTFTNPQYLTAFNARGYNNQPDFLDRNQLLVSVQLPEMQQPDVFLLNLQTKERTRMTRTLPGEFSPKGVGDGRKFAAVRQEYLGRDTVLRLWEFPANLTDNGRPVFKYVNGIGYYEYLNSSQLALFLVGVPNTLAIASVDSDSPRNLANNVGRCFKRQPNGNLAYVSKAGPQWQLVEQNLYRLNTPPTVIAPTIRNSEDFVILSDGSFLMGGGSKIYRFDPIRNPRWTEVVDLRFYGITNITRMAVNGAGKLAIVDRK